MKREEAEKLGREAAERDIAEGIIDSDGLVIDEERLRAHLRYRIHNYIDSTDFSVRDLRQFLSDVGMPNDYVGASSIVCDLIIERVGNKLSNGKKKIALVKADDDLEDPLFRKREGYLRHVLAGRKANAPVSHE